MGHIVHSKFHRIKSCCGGINRIQLCFAVGISGVVSCLIHGIDFFEYSHEGDLIIFSDKNRRSQTYLEGIIVSGLTIFFGVFLFVLYFGSKLPIFLGRDVVIVFALAICAAIAIELSAIYRQKTPWYSLDRLLPPAVLEWLSQPIKKNSGVPKRLLRLAQYVAMEWVDFPSFWAKCDYVLIGYLKKYLEQTFFDRRNL
jgi:hypothetical protein